MEKFLYVFGIALVLSGCADYQSSFPGSDSGSWFDPNDRCWIPGPCAATVLPATDGYYTEYSYDDDGFLVSQQVYDDYRPKVLTTYQYNHSGQLEVVTEQWTGSEAWRTVYIYGGGGQLIREENRDSTGWLSERITYRYDENSRLAQKVHEFDSPNVKQWIDFSYDEQGNLLLEEQTYESIFGVRLKCTHHSRDESGHATTVATDEECDGVFEKAIRTSTDENGCVVLREEFEGLDRLDRFTQTACDSCGKRLWSTSYQVEAEGPVEYETETFEYGCWE